jgi:hypothetical protein
MKPGTLIDANEFLETLMAKGLMIVSVKEFEASKDIERQRMMRKKALTLTEIVRCGLLPVKTSKGVNDWILNGKIKPGEYYQESKGYKRIMILTAAIKRLGYAE